MLPQGIKPGPPARRWGGEKGDLQKEPPGGIVVEPADHGRGRSRGGLTSRIHLAVEQGQKPLPVVITAGLRGDSPQFEPVLEAIRIPRLGSVGCASARDRVRADKAYAPRSNRSYLRLGGGDDQRALLHAAPRAWAGAGRPGAARRR
ncbi:transposase [Streptomyces sp. NPDC059496]|uniref:transposase n=1 Tax=Streptomyces sp. NPDC059496 TaxID=3346851 RepID=UPI00369EBB00